MHSTRKIKDDLIYVGGSDRRLSRFEKIDELVHIRVYALQSAGQACVRRCGDHAALNECLPITLGIHHAETDGGDPGVNAQNSHSASNKISVTPLELQPAEKRRPIDSAGSIIAHSPDTDNGECRFQRVLQAKTPVNRHGSQ